MKEVNFSWVGSEDSEEGHAVYSTREGVTLLSLNLPSFKHAHSIHLAMESVLKAGYFDGVREAESIMKTAMRNLMR